MLQAIPQTLVAERLRFMPLSSSAIATPRTPSISLFLNPTVPRSQPRVAAAAQPLIAEMAPKLLIEPHTRPAAPLLPRIKASAVVEPMSAVNAAISEVNVEHNDGRDLEELAIRLANALCLIAIYSVLAVESLIATAMSTWTGIATGANNEATTGPGLVTMPTQLPKPQDNRVKRQRSAPNTR